MGKGVVIFRKTSPSTLAAHADGPAAILHLNPPRGLRCRPIMEPQPTIIRGRFIDLFDAHLGVVVDPMVGVGERRLLLDPTFFPATHAQILSASGKVLHEQATANSLSFAVTSIEARDEHDLTAVRVRLPRPMQTITLDGKPLKAAQSDAGSLLLNAKNSGYVRYARYTNHQPNIANGLSIIDRGFRYTDHQNGGGAQLVTVLSPNLLNELRVGRIQRDTGDFPVVNTSPAGSVLINISSVANIGFSPRSTTTTTERSTAVVDNVTWTHGRHTFKFGGEFDHELFASLSSTTPTFTLSGLAAQNGQGAVGALNQYLDTQAGTIDPSTGNPYSYTFLMSYSGSQPSASPSISSTSLRRMRFALPRAW